MNLGLLKVYLAGGMRSDWQDRVIEVCPQFTYLDPRKHGLSDPMEYTEWDMNAIHQCHVFIRYMEATNPGGPNCSFETGIAVALGKMIISIDEKQDKYDKMAWVSANVRFLEFENFLKWWSGFPARVQLDGKASTPIIISTQN